VKILKHLNLTSVIKHKMISYSTLQTIMCYHLNNIYKESELNKFATVKEILTVQKEEKNKISGCNSASD